MTKVIAGLFNDSKEAGEAVADLKAAGFTEDISVIAKDSDKEEVSEHLVKTDVTGGAVGGAVTGGALGGLLGLLAGVATVVAPGIGTLIVAGPLAAAWGLTGAAAGALTGGLVGALTDAGISKDKAKQFEEAVQRGEVLVVVSADEKSETKVRSILDNHHVKASAMGYAAA